MFRRGWEVFAENRLALAGLGFVIFIVLFCFVGPLIYHTHQVNTTLTRSYCTPSAQHLLGCDDLGYDQLGRLMVGGQTSLEVGFAAAFVSCPLGTLYGAVSGFAGGMVDSFMMRIVDAVLSIPFIFVLIILSVLFHPDTADHDLLHRRVLLAGRGPAGPRRDALAAHQGVRAGGQGHRRPAAPARSCGTSCRTRSARSSCRPRSRSPTRS